MKIKDKDLFWIVLSFLMYSFVRVIEYTTGQKGSPEYIVDFLPYLLPISFIIVDKILRRGEE